MWEWASQRRGLATTPAGSPHAAGAGAYVTFVEILPQELRSAADRILKVAAVLVGFAVVTTVLFIKL